jgi:hypothetical protein
MVGLHASHKMAVEFDPTLHSLSLKLCLGGRPHAYEDSHHRQTESAHERERAGLRPASLKTSWNG